MVVRLIIQLYPLIQTIKSVFESIIKLHNFGYVIFIRLLQSLGKYGTFLVVITHT